LNKNLIANYFGSAWSAIIGIIFLPIYLKYLGFEAFALIGLFTSLQAFLSLLDMGITPTLSREIARLNSNDSLLAGESIHDLLKSVEFIVVALVIFLVTTIVISSNWIADYWLNSESISSETVAISIVIMAFVLALKYIEGIYRSALFALERQVYFNVVNSIITTTRVLGVVFILMWISPTITAFFYWQGAVSIVFILLLRKKTYSSLPLISRTGLFSTKSIKIVFQFASGMMIINLLKVAITQTDKILLSKLLPLKEYGSFTFVNAFAVGLFVLIGPITQTFYPKFCRDYVRNNNDGLKNDFRLSSQLVSVIPGSIAIVIIFFSESILQIWTNNIEIANKYAPLLSILMIGNLLNGLAWVPYQIQLAIGLTRNIIFVNCISIVIIVIGNLWFTPEYGAMGAACVWLFCNCGILAMNLFFIIKKAPFIFSWPAFFRDTILPLGVASITAILLSFFWQKHFSIWIDLFLVAIVLSLTFLSALLVTNKLWPLLFNIIRKKSYFR